MMATVSMRMNSGGVEVQAAHGCALEALARPCDVLVIAAHPDDEAQGLAATLGKLAARGCRVRVLHVTDGAPRNPALRPSLRRHTVKQAAAFRRLEAEAALGGEDITLLPSLGIPDHEAAEDLVGLTLALEPIIATADVVVTHPYEGGHPDHDATAFAVHAAAGHTLVAEMTSYHRNALGGLEPGVFLGRAACGVSWPGDLDAADFARRDRILAAYASQREVLARLRIRREPIRCAPVYDFTSPPHEGRLWYEDVGLGWTAERFLARARAATWLFAPDRGVASPASGSRTTPR